MFECLVTAWHLHSLRLQCCRTTARMPGSYGTSQSSSNPIGVPAGHARQVTLSSADSSRWPGPSMTGCVTARRWCSNRRCATFLRRWRTSSPAPIGGRHGAKPRRDEGFRVVALRAEHVRRLSRKTAEVWIPKAGWVRFRWSRAVPEGVKSYRVTLDRAGRWHIAFAAIPKPIPSPGTGRVVGIDRGVTISAALSTGEMLTVPRLSSAQQRRLRRLQRKLARAKPGSNRRARVKLAIAKLRAREADTRRDWTEKTSTDLARRFDVIRLEDLQVVGMTRSAKGTTQNPGRNVHAKAGLNREILRSGWGLLVRRLEDKAPDRVEKDKTAFH